MQAGEASRESSPGLLRGLFGSRVACCNSTTGFQRLEPKTPEKGKSSEPDHLHDHVFQLLIFQGVMGRKNHPIP